MKYILIALMLISAAQAQDTLIVYYKGDYKPPPAGTFWLTGQPDTRPTSKKGPQKDCNCEAGIVKRGTYCDICHGPCDNCESCKCKRVNKRPCSTGLVFATLTIGQRVEIIKPER